MVDQTAFALLGLPARFHQDAALIDEHWKRAIALVHPDRFAGRGEQEKRVAEQWAGRINDAKATLLNPVLRAKLLLETAGVTLDAESDTKMPADFLMQQIEWRERVESGGDYEALRAEVEASYASEISLLEKSLDETHDYGVARDAVRRVMFLDKIKRELSENE